MINATDRSRSLSRSRLTTCRPRVGAALGALTVLVLVSLGGCREKHEPLKPTVAAAPAYAGAGATGAAS